MFHGKKHRIPFAAGAPTSGVKLTVRAGDSTHEYWAYVDIHDEPFSVYPVVEPLQ